MLFLLLAVCARNLARILLASLAGFILGFYQHGYYLSQEKLLTDYFNQELIIELRLVSDLQEKKNSLRGRGELISYNYIISTTKSQIYLNFKSVSVELHEGDILRVKGKMSRGFGDYAAAITNPELLSISRSPPSFLRRLRQSFISRLRSVFDGDDCSSLALAYLIGDKRSLSDDFLGQLRNVGLSHIVVASGFHLGVVISLARRFLGKISRFAAVAGAGLLIVIYLALIGLSASLLRAGIVSTMTLCFDYFGRRLHPARAIIYAIALSLIYDPSFLTNVGWLLSFAAYVGIVIIVPIVQRFLYGSGKVSWVAQIFITTVAAQISCAPVSLYFFGGLSFLGIIANLLISPTIPMVMGLSFVSSILPICAIPAKLILKLQIAIVGLLSKWRWGILSIESGNWYVFLLYLPIIIMVLYMAWRERFRFRSRRLAKTQKYGKIYLC